MDSKKILLVEDDPDDQALTLRALEKNGIGGEVVVANDGIEALDYLSCTSGQDDVPRLVLVGSKLPKMDGPEVLRRLRSDERTKSLPVVLLTSCEEDEDSLADHGPRADACISRAVDFARFSQSLQHLKPLLAGA